MEFKRQMYIGKVSKITGASRKAIRHYEEIGLLLDIERLGSYRIYNEHHIVIIGMIKRARKLGFKLADIAPLVGAKQQGNQFPLDIAHQAIAEKRAEIQLAIQQARQLDKALEALKAELDHLFLDNV